MKTYIPYDLLEALGYNRGDWINVDLKKASYETLLMLLRRVNETLDRVWASLNQPISRSIYLQLFKDEVVEQIEMIEMGL